MEKGAAFGYSGGCEANLYSERTPMRLDTLKGVFRATFDRKIVEQAARDAGAFTRIRDITPYDLLLSLVTACCIGPRRSIAAARRAYERLSGSPISPGAFDARLDTPGCVRWTWQLLTDQMARANRATRRRWPAPLQALAAVLVQDGTCMKVRATAPFDSTQPAKRAVKMLGTLSLDHGALLDVRFAAAVHHDHPLLRGQLVAGALYLRDLGFYDHREFVAIDEENAFFVSRLKYNAKPTVQRVFCGLPAQGLQGEELHDGLPYEPVVDLDAHFRVEGEPNGHVFRVVKVDVPAKDRRGRPTGESLECWYVTNLPRDRFSAEMISLLYRLRWAVERQWRSGKDLARLDHLNTGRPTVLWVFIAVSLLLQTLADQISTELRASRMRSTVSSEIVFATVIEWWNEIARWLRRSDGFEQIRWIAFRNVLVYDSRHRHPKRPRRMEQVLDEIERHAQKRKVAA